MQKHQKQISGLVTTKVQHIFKVFVGSDTKKNEKNPTEAHY